MKLNIRERLKNYWRVLKIAKKPTLSEFSRTARICFIGLIIIGIIGFLIYLLTAPFMV